MAIDVEYSYRIGLLGNEDRLRIYDMLHTLGFHLELPELEARGVDALLDGIEEFREHLGGVLTITLLERIGRKRDVHEIDLAGMRGAISAFLPGRRINRAS